MKTKLSLKAKILIGVFIPCALCSCAAQSNSEPTREIPIIEEVSTEQTTLAALTEITTVTTTTEKPTETTTEATTTTETTTKAETTTTELTTQAPAPVVRETPPPIENNDIIVYIGETGNKYHKASCRTLKGNGSPITLTEAQAQGRTACKICGG